MPTSVQRPTRRGLLMAGGILTVASAAAAAGVAAGVTAEQLGSAHGPAPKADETAPSDLDALPDRYDPEQRYLQLVGSGDGVLYAIQADGKLQWHRHTGWETNTAHWAPGSGRVIHAGWHRYRVVMGAEDGSLFALRGDGSIVLKRYLLTDAESGMGIWSDEVEVGAGFERFDKVFGYDGYIYGLSETGALVGFRYSQAGQRLIGGGEIGRGFAGALFGADTDGVIYSYHDNGLAVFRYLGDLKWANSANSVTVGSNIGEMAGYGAVFFGGSGRVYYSYPGDPRGSHDGSLYLHRLTNYTSAAGDRRAGWATNVPTVVGGGFTFGAQANLQGYTYDRAVCAGGSVVAAISTTFAEVDASVVRLAPAGQGPAIVTAPVAVTGQLQGLPAGYVHSGCGWAESFRSAVPADWPSGVYALRLTGPEGLTRNLPFIVRPAKAAQAVAVILPTNTYLAYNTWGGHSQYCSCSYLRSGQRKLSFHRPPAYDPTQRGGMQNFGLFADLILLRWMTVKGLSYDVYSDDDLDQQADLLTPYRAVVLPTHPEYYTERQRDHLLAYQESGGHTLYLGGNGIYERVGVTADRSALVFRTAKGLRDVYSALNKPASQLLGTNWNPTNWATSAPYEVVRDHPFLAGTGLKPGATFGLHGVNGPASGGEVDCRMGQGHEVGEADVFARGQNPGTGAEMLVRHGSNGGFLFSVGSVAFTGALFTSDAVSGIVQNAFEHALARV